MPNIDKVYLFEKYTLFRTRTYIKKVMKRRLKNPSHEKNVYTDMVIYGFESQYVRRWIVSLISVISKRGELEKYTNYVWLVIRKIKKKYNLFCFFSIIEENLTIVFDTFKKKIAGKNVLVPLGLNHYKRVNTMSKLIMLSLKLRKENFFVDKLYNELLDVLSNKGISITKKMNYTKQLKDIITNIRFLNERY